ncbi:MAG: PilZ domain-containing protein [Ruminococcus sp.]|jgi:hypothetical protein|nr:PilZ domain-containing protein [Ruminococcus sp.]
MNSAEKNTRDNLTIKNRIASFFSRDEQIYNPLTKVFSPGAKILFKTNDGEFYEAEILEKLNHSLIISMPYLKKIGFVDMREGDTAEIILTDSFRGKHSFSAEISEVDNVENTLTVNQTSNVSVHQVREFVRIPVQMLGRLTGECSNNGNPVKLENAKVMVIDLSISGCRIQTDIAGIMNGDRFALKFPKKFPINDRDYISVGCEVKNFFDDSENEGIKNIGLCFFSADWIPLVDADRSEEYRTFYEFVKRIEKMNKYFTK